MFSIENFGSYAHKFSFLFILISKAPRLHNLVICSVFIILSSLSIEFKFKHSGSNMATASSSSSYKITWINDVAGVKQSIKDLGREKEIAVDCEGMNLSREGTLDILSIATRHRDVYLFDIAKLGALAFEAGLKGLLESDRTTHTKLLYDCRNDADALLHIYDVKLAGVLDLQLLEVIHRRNRGQRIEYLRGLKKSLETYVNDQKMEIIKRKGINEIEESKKKDVNIWAARPLSDELKEYCAVDVAALFPLQKILKKGKDAEDMKIVLEGSERFSDYFRSYEVLPMKEFIWNPFLPQKILRFNFIRNTTEEVKKCQGCRKEFRKAELKISCLAQQAWLCGVCKKVEIRAKDAVSMLKWLKESV